MGGVSGTRKCVYQEWPDKIFPIAKFPSFPLWGGGGGLGVTPPPSIVYGHSNTSLG